MATNQLLLNYLKQYEEDPHSRVFAPLADQYRKLGKTHEALKICLDGLKHHSKYLGGRVALAHCYADLNQFENALREYEYVLAQTPDNLHALKGAARCYQQLQENEKALRYYRMYQFLAPKDPVIREHIAGLESQLQHRKNPKPTTPASGSNQQQFHFQHDSDEVSPYDLYRLSSVTRTAPAQRSSVSALKTLEENQKKEADQRIRTLYTLLRVIQKRRALGPSSPH